MHAFFLHQRDKFLKKVVAVMRTGGSFWMILNAEEREMLMLKTFYCVVVEIDVSQLDIRLVHRLPIDGEAVVL